MGSLTSQIFESKVHSYDEHISGRGFETLYARAFTLGLAKVEYLCQNRESEKRMPMVIGFGYLSIYSYTYSPPLLDKMQSSTRSSKFDQNKFTFTRSSPPKVSQRPATCSSQRKKARRRLSERCRTRNHCPSPSQQSTSRLMRHRSREQR